MSYESFERIVESSHKMIAKELKDNLKDHFVPRKGLRNVTCHIPYVTYDMAHITWSMWSFELTSPAWRSEYNCKRSEVETLKFKYSVAQETIEQLRKELKLKEEALKQLNSGGVFFDPKRSISDWLKKIKTTVEMPPVKIFLRKTEITSNRTIWCWYSDPFLL